MTIEKILEEFEKEFKNLSSNFQIHKFTLDKTKEKIKLDELVMPGVYVFFRGDKIVRIGRSLSNSRKRALEHIKDNTAGWMKQLDNDPNTTLILFNIKHSKDIHWVAALEIFFEMKFKYVIEIPSQIG